jgi:hypothetical protein
MQHITIGKIQHREVAFDAFFGKENWAEVSSMVLWLFVVGVWSFVTMGSQ